MKPIGRDGWASRGVRQSRRPSRRPSPAQIVALLALAVAISGVAVAAPGEGGTIQSCFDERGTLRVVDTGATCGAGETALSWNQQGPPGPRGTDGAAGPPGPAGPMGGSDPAQQGGVAGPTDEAARSPELSAPVKRPKIKIKKKKPKIKIGPPPPGTLYQYSNVDEKGPPTGDFVYLEPAGTSSPVKTVARLELPRGRFFVIADAEGLASGPENHNNFWDANVLCELHTTDQGRVAEKALRRRNVRAFTMQAAAFSNKPSAIELRCQNLVPTTSAFLRNITISAVTISSAHLDWE